MIAKLRRRILPGQEIVCAKTLPLEGRMAEASAVDVLGALALAGLLGAAGQAVRAIGGLKKMADDAQARGLAPFETFVTSRFVISMIVGFVAGMVAAVSLGLSKLIPVNLDNSSLMLGLAAAGYGGTDFLDAFARKMTGAAPAQPRVQLVAPPAEPSPAGAPAAATQARQPSTKRKSRRSSY
jgi:hypothetical protein